MERLFAGYVQRTRAYFGDKAKTIEQKRKAAETSHLQSMAALFSRELRALSFGVGECKAHPDRVQGACPICDGLWPGP